MHTKLLDEYTSQFGNKFEAINRICKESRCLLDKYPGVLSESEAITWICTNKPPRLLNYKLAVKESKIDTVIKYAEDKCCEIIDDEIAKSVIDSIHLSQLNKYMCYEYNNLESEYKKSRVRIIVKMIWYEYQEIESEDL